jgi:dihydrolipoamide dehydrogenase
MNEKQIQLLVIGGGPAGYPAAFYALDLGMKVTMVDEEKNPGGVCLYRGCIPSKALLHLAKLIRETREAHKWGLTFSEPQIDLEKVRLWKQSVVEKLTKGLGSLGKQRKIDHIQGRAVFDSPQSVIVTRADGAQERLTFEKCILATGSHPTKLPGVKLQSSLLWDSTDALEMRDIPNRLLVVGGGYIGLELGSVYSALGSEVCVAEMASALLPGADKDLVQPLARRLEKQFSNIWLDSRVETIVESDEGLTVTIKTPEGTREEKFAAVLVSIGRTPNSRNLGLDVANIAVDKKGFVQVGPNRETSNKNVFAIGDVAGEPMLAHKGTAEAKVAVESIAGKKTVFEPRGIPAVVFTDPEIAWVGLTETEAQQKNLTVQIARFPWSASGRALTLDRTEGLTKLIIDPQTERVLGFGICGVGAGDLIGEGALALEMGATAADIAYTIHPHPTLTESIMEAAEVFYGHCTHMAKPSSPFAAKPTS